MHTVHVAWSEALTGYDFGPGHPLNPVRVDLTIRLARELGVLGADGVHVEEPEPADDAALRRVHTADYLDAVKAASADPGTVDLEHGLGTTDDPCFAGMHEASALVAGGTIAAARAVWEGRARHGVNVAGGLHHAMPGSASGFCVYNDPAAAIRWLLDAGCPRVAYVDLDVHHGDGVQEIFYDEPRVLTISLHETPRTLFPQTGYPSETGGPNAEGYAVNVALPPVTGDAGWLRAFHAVVPPLLRAFEPTVLVSQHGCDSHSLDPLAHLELTVDGQRAAYLAVHELAHEICAGRWVATGGGGYALVDVVPRAWTHLLAILAGRPLAPHTMIPAPWRAYVRDRLGRDAPVRMSDDGSDSYTEWTSGYDPGSSLDRAIQATRMAVFPSHGLDPQP